MPTAERFTDAEFPDRPYPGARPDFSFVHDERCGYRVTASRSGWLVGPERLEDWLSARGAPPLPGRHAVLSYGSNACPSKISWLRTQLGLPGPAVVLRARTEGLAAVWAAGRRVVDEQRPATLAAAPGVHETHGVWLATDEQLAVLDVCEGRGDRYHLARLRTGTVTLDDATVLVRPLAYVGASAPRRPLLVDGAPVRCAQVGQQVAGALQGVPAGSDGLDLEIV